MFIIIMDSSTLKVIVGTHSQQCLHPFKDSQLIKFNIENICGYEKYVPVIANKMYHYFNSHSYTSVSTYKFLAT